VERRRERARSRDRGARFWYRSWPCERVAFHSHSPSTHSRSSQCPVSTPLSTPSLHHRPGAPAEVPRALQHKLEDLNLDADPLTYLLSRSTRGRLSRGSKQRAPPRLREVSTTFVIVLHIAVNPDIGNSSGVCQATVQQATFNGQAYILAIAFNSWPTLARQQATCSVTPSRSLDDFRYRLAHRCQSWHRQLIGCVPSYSSSCLQNDSHISTHAHSSEVDNRSPKCERNQCPGPAAARGRRRCNRLNARSTLPLFVLQSHKQLRSCVRVLRCDYRSASSCQQVTFQLLAKR
jgi:hypothetical protein